MVEIVGLASGTLVLALNLLQLIFMLGIVIIALLMAKSGRTWVGYLLALGVVSLAAHNVLEVLTEVENLLVALFKTIATILIFLAVWLFSVLEEERLKLAGYSGKLEKEVEARAKELGESEERYRGLVETMHEFVSEINPDGTFNFVNKPFAESTGYATDELSGTNFFSYLHPDDVAPTSEHCRLLQETKYPIRNCEYRFRKKDGAYLNLITNGDPVYDAEGNLKSILQVSFDITERRQAEEALRTSEEKYRSLVETAFDGIGMLDGDGNFAFVNDKYCDMLGYSKEELLAKNFADTLPPEKREERMRLFRELINEKLPFAMYEGKNLKKDGSLIDVQIKWSFVYSNGAVSTLGIVRDVTEHKRAEQALKTYTAQLEEANRLKNLFTDIMRHDLQNPAGIIKNTAELMLDEAEGTVREDLGLIHRNIKKLINIIESASRLAKLESEKELKLEQRDLGAVMQEVISNFEPFIKEKKMRVEYEQKKAPAMVNPVIEEVFANILSNAIKYSPEKSRIVVGIEEEGENWKVGIKDYGEGIPDEYKKAIFDRFKRLHKSGVKGSGLGLAIVKRIVELHKGSVWVEDNLGGGSIFYVRMPKSPSDFELSRHRNGMRGSEGPE